MEVIAYEMEYANINLLESSIECIPFNEVYFQEYMQIYNDCFYEMRKSLDIEPYNFLSEFGQIENKIDDIFLLMEYGVRIPLERNSRSAIAVRLSGSNR